MDKKGAFRFIAEQAYSIPGRGVVVTGKVEEGSVSVGSEIGFLGTDGKWTIAMVIGIEVSRRLVEEAEAGQRASILLEGVKKDQITLGTVLTEVPGAPVSLSSPPSLPAPPPVAPSPSMPTLGEAIQPPSSFWRTVLFILIGILVILAILYVQGKWDPKKFDPKKWDPRKMSVSMEQPTASNKPSFAGSGSLIAERFWYF
jgi:hypothetical protein